MKKHTRNLVHAAIIAALYAALTHLQNMLLPGSATWAIQMRMSEALSVLAFFTPAAAMGLAVGCLVCLLTAAMGVYMIRRANREIKTLQENTHGESFL